MEYISEYATLVQFVGTFNFVFATKFFHEHFSTHFIDVSKKQKDNFDTIKNKISTDITTIESHSPLKHNGKSNEHELNELNSKYKQALSKIETIYKRNSTQTENKKQPAYSRQLFLLIGLYSLLTIFYFGKIGHLSAHSQECNDWCNSLCAFAITTILWWIYFLLSEIIWLIRKSKKPNPALFSPSFSWTIILFIISSLFIMILHAKCPNIAINSDYKVYAIVALPLLAFVSSILLFVITNSFVWLTTIWHTVCYKLKLWLLARKKRNVLSPYGHLRGDTSLTIS